MQFARTIDALAKSIPSDRPFESLERRSLMTGTIIATDQGIYPTDTATAADGTHYFAASVGRTGNELWKSDGTAAGTVLVRDSTPGKASSDITTITPFKDGVAYLQFDATKKTFTLWVSDGSKPGTRQVSADMKDVKSFVALGDQLIVVTGVGFSQKKGLINDTALWTTDGTSVGTKRVQAINGSLLSTQQTPIQRVGNRAVFSTDNGIWSTDGTAAGTVAIVTRPQQGRNNVSRICDVGQLTDGGVYVFFLSDNGPDHATAWATDGTPQGTVKLADAGQAYLYGQQTAGGRLYFVSGWTADTSDDPNLRDVWETDGTVAGTRVVSQVKGIPRAVGRAGTKLIIATEAGTTLAANDAARYLYSYDTAAGTSIELLKTETSSLQTFNTVSDTLFFVESSTDRKGRAVDSVWETDGTVLGTKRVYTSVARPFFTSVAGNQLVLQDEGVKTLHLLDPIAPQPVLARTELAADLRNGTLRVFGTGGDDTIRISQSDANPTRLVINLNGVKHSFPMNLVRRLQVWGYDGDDRIAMIESHGKLGFRSNIDAGNGNDLVFTGGGRDTLDGGFGQDTLHAGNNDDVLIGGNGDDLLIADNGNDVVDGGNGKDSISGGNGDDRITGGDDQQADILDGNRGSDVLIGQSVVDVFFAGNTGKLDPDDLILQ